MASITELLRELMEELTREQDGTIPPEPLHDGELCQWKDDEHIYFEADLGTDLIFHVDINIHSGRAFIMMTRS